MLKNKLVKEKSKKKSIHPLPIYRLFPSIITIMALCAGLTSIRYGFDHKWEHSMLLLIIAAFLDVMDGAKATPNLKIIASTNLREKMDSAFLRRMEI